MAEPVPRESNTSTAESGSNDSLTQDNALLDINPSSVLQFPKGQETVSQKVTLRNLSASSVAFKFKTNNIEAYTVRPPIGIMKSRSTLEVSVQLVAGHSCLPKDKLMVVSMELENANTNVEELPALWLSTPQDDQHNYKIRCQHPTTDKKPDSMKRFHGDIERVHQKMSNLMLSTDSLKLQQRVMQVILLLMLLFMVALLWMLYSMTVVMQGVPGSRICETYGSVLASLVCS